MLIRILAISVLWLCCSLSHAEEVVEIPLSEIWGHNIQGTKKIRNLDKDSPIDALPHELIEKSNNVAIYRRLNSMRDNIPPCFVVEGSVKDALAAARDVLYGKVKNQDSFDADKELMLVFFAGAKSPGLSLKPIEIEGNRISVNYVLLETKIANLVVNTHYALIPLGELSPGSYEVNISPSEPDIVCGSTTFEVKKGK